MTPVQTAQVFAAALVAAGLLGWLTGEHGAPVPSSDPSLTDGAMVAVRVPDRLSEDAAEGARLFDTHCATCHGSRAAGLDGAGPPLVHKIYEPGHHGDMAFHVAVRNGVRSHHWRFGDMPAVEGLSEGEIDRIIAYVRLLQRHNGVD